MISTYKYRIYLSNENKKLLELYNEAYWSFIKYLKYKSICNYQKYGFHLSLKVMLNLIYNNKDERLHRLLKETNVNLFKCAAIHLSSALTKNKPIDPKEYLKNNIINLSLFEDNFLIKDKMISFYNVKNIKIRSKIIYYPYCIPKTLLIKKETGERYFALVTCYFDDIKTKNIDINNSIGLDYSLKHFYIDSNGNYPDFPFDAIRPYERKISIYKNKLKKQTENSNNYERTKRKLKITSNKISNIRKFFQVNLANQLAEKYDIICVENISSKIIASVNNKDSNNSKYKFGFNVYRLAYDKFQGILKKKCEMNGKIFIKIEKFYKSSQTCSKCGNINRDTKDLSLRIYTCNKCGFTCDRDINAAINIKNKGIEEYKNSLKK